MTTLKHNGNSGRSSTSTFMGPFVVSPCAMLQVAFSYMETISDMSLPGIPLQRSALRMAQWFRVSNASPKSTNIRYNGYLQSTIRPFVKRRPLMWSIPYLPKSCLCIANVAGESIYQSLVQYIRNHLIHHSMESDASLGLTLSQESFPCNLDRQSLLQSIAKITSVKSP